jgi:hypothetical protein
MSSPHTSVPIPNPSAAPFRPSPARAASLQSASIYIKSRAASQPAGERFPVPPPDPAARSNSPGSPYGVIGESRIPARFGNGLSHTHGAATRANSFSVAEMNDRRVRGTREYG